MEQNEQGKRKGAAKEFQASLDHLQHLLEENQTEEQLTPKLEVDKVPQKQVAEDTAIFDLAEWEDAVADIEQYFESKDKQT